MWRIVGLAIAICIAIACAGLWIYRIDLATAAALRVLERQGLGPAHLVIERVDLSGLHARDIKLYGGAVEAAGLTLGYAPLELFAKHVALADIDGLRVKLSTDGNEIMLGGRPLRPSAASEPASPLPRFKIDALKLDDAWIALDRPDGRLEAKFSTTLALNGADLRNAAFSVDFVVPMDGPDLALRVAVPAFGLSARDDGALRLDFARATVTPRDLPWIAEEIGGEVIWRADKVTAKFAVGNLRSLQKPALIQPLRLAGDATLTGKRVDFTLHAHAETAGAKDKLEMVVNGHHDSATNSGSASISVPPMIFRSKAVQPADFAPALGGTLPDVAGSVAVSGSARWQDFVLSPDIVVTLADLAVVTPGARLSQINGEIHLVGLWPPETPPKQTLKGVVEAGGLPPNKFALDFHLLPTSVLMVEAATVDFASGKISTSSFAVDPKKPEIGAMLRVDQVDLAELFKLINIDGIGGTGRLDGNIPLRLAGKRIRISNGTLAASGPGVLRLSSGKVPEAIGQAGESAKLVLDALGDFHYEILALELNQADSGAGTILIKLQGHNPAVLDGRRFNFNIKFESDFDRLTDLVVASMTAAQELLRKTTQMAR
ncbi:MAG: intermembrane phospholipid transport protein YdbH family protein [Alphaproteobacteria bacterium]